MSNHDLDRRDRLSLRPCRPTTRAKPKGPTPAGPERRAWNRDGRPKGAYPTASGRYQARFSYAGRDVCCGVFDTAEQAAAAVAAKRKELAERGDRA